MMRRLLLRCVLVAFVGGGVTPVFAGQACGEVVISPETTAQALALAKRVRQKAESLDANRVLLLARVGQDLSKYNMRFSHLAFLVKTHPEGSWSVVHELNECGTDKSSLYVQGLGDFFMDGMFAYEAALMSLPDDVQSRLETFLSSARMKRFHQAKYNLLAYPFSTKYQNSNQWLLETLVANMAPEGDVVSRVEAQNWLKSEGFEPTRLNISTMTRLGGRMFKANVAFDDHPDDLRWANKIDVVSVDAVFTFLRKRYPNDTRRSLVDLLE